MSTQLTKTGESLMALIGRGQVPFDGEIEENAGTAHETLIGETIGTAGVPSTREGVSDLIAELAADGFLTVHDDGEKGAWVVLTRQGADTAKRVARKALDEPEPLVVSEDGEETPEADTDEG